MTTATTELLLAHRDNPSLADCYRVMLDVDSTLYPLLPAMAGRDGGSRVSYDACPSWRGLADLVDGGVPRMLEMFDECFDYDVMREHAPFDGAADELARLADLGARYTVMTSRPVQFTDGTRRWLADHGLGYEAMLCDLDHDKVAECQKRGIGIAVDDHPDFIERAHAAGMDVLGLRYNYNAQAFDDAGLPGAGHWGELGQQIHAAIERRLRARLDG